MPGNVQEIYELSIARLPTEQYDRTILSLLVRCLSIGRGKHGCPSHSLIFLHALHLLYALENAALVKKIYITSWIKTDSTYLLCFFFSERHF